MDTFVQSEVEAVSKGGALILPKGRVQLFGDPEDYNVQETEENRAASQGAGPGLKPPSECLWTAEASCVAVS